MKYLKLKTFPLEGHVIKLFMVAIISVGIGYYWGWTDKDSAIITSALRSCYETREQCWNKLEKCHEAGLAEGGRDEAL
jgi:hypothetical protein